MPKGDRAFSDRFEFIYMESRYMVLNLEGWFFAIIALIPLTFVIFLTRHYKIKCLCMHVILPRISNLFFLSFQLRMFIENFLVWTLAALINVLYLGFKDSVSIVSSLLCLLFLLASVLSPVFTYWFGRKNYY